MAKQSLAPVSETSVRGMSRAPWMVIVVVGALLVGGTLLPVLVGTVSAMPVLTGTVQGTSSPTPSAFRGYNVTFTETGLPRGTAWSVTFNGTVYNAGRRGITITEIPNGTYAWNVSSYAGLVPTPSSGPMTIAGAPVSQTITFAPPPGRYTVTFTETGLPFGTAWGVTFNNTYYSVTFGTTITVNNVLNSTYAWNVSSFVGLYPTPTSGSITVNGGPQSQAITFAALPGHYAVTFTETGLPFGTTWGITFNNTYYISGFAGGGATITVNGVANNTYAWNSTQFASLFPTPSSGSITVNGGAQSQAITFAALPGHYTVTFTELGLPIATPWSLTFNGTVYSSATAALSPGSFPNNTYQFTVGLVSGYTANPSSGTVTVAGASPPAQHINFTVGPPRFSVTFSELGLPMSTSWSVTFNASVYPGVSGATIVIPNLLNNSYTFSVAPLGRWAPSPSSGTITVNGAAMTQAISFALTPMTYGITFTAFGLPSSLNWSITLNGSTVTMKGAPIVFNLVNASYTYTVGAVTGFKAFPPSGTVNVTGSAVPVTIAFTAVAPLYTVTFYAKGLPSTASWSVTLNGTVSSASASNIVFSETNGKYSYSITAPSGYTASPSSGTLTVAGGAMGQNVTFSSNSNNGGKSVSSTLGTYVIPIIVVVIIVVAVIALLILRRRGQGKPPAADDGETPGMTEWKADTKGDTSAPASGEAGSPTPSADTGTPSTAPQESSSEPHSEEGASPPPTEDSETPSPSSPPEEGSPPPSGSEADSSPSSD